MDKKWITYDEYCIVKFSGKLSPKEWLSLARPWAEGVKCPYRTSARLMNLIEESVQSIILWIEAASRGIFASSVSENEVEEIAKQAIDNLRQQRISALYGK